MHNQDKSAESMTDYQFQQYKKYHDKCDALTRELNELKAIGSQYVND